MTSTEEWHAIVKMCQDTGCDNLAIDILAALTLQGVMRNAATKAEEMEKTEGQKDEQETEENKEEMAVINSEKHQDEVDLEQASENRVVVETVEILNVPPVLLRPSLEDLGLDEDI